MLATQFRSSRRHDRLIGPLFHSFLAATVFLTVSGFFTTQSVATAKDEQPLAEPTNGPEKDDLPVTWLSEYRQAVKLAKKKEAMLLVEFVELDGLPIAESEVWSQLDEDVQRKIQEMVLVSIPVDAKIEIDGEQVTVLKHEAFQHMQGRTGLSIIDFASNERDFFERVVSVLPQQSEREFSKHELTCLLTLPAASLTQRTLIYAVRLHGDSPLSADGDENAYLLQQAEKHSLLQARIRLQGHHSWEQRFHEINSTLASQSTSKEVCAESWPHQSLFDAAEECVHSWRQSSGHWSAVVAPHTFYGYDMKLGSNGIWYATGIFSDTPKSE